MSRFNKSKGVAPLSVLAATVAAEITNRGKSMDSSMVTGMIGLESLDDSKFNALESQYADVKAAIQSAAQSAGLALENFAEHQWESATIAAMAFANPVEYAKNALTTRQVSGSNSVKVMGMNAMSGVPSYYLDKDLGMEAFSESDLTAYMQETIAFNLEAPRQNEYAEGFYPTVIVSPDQAGLQIQIERPVVFQPVRHLADGTPTDFDYKPLLDGILDHTILEDYSTDLVPHRRTGPGGNDNHFLSVGLYTRRIEDVDVPTGFLKANMEHGFIGLSAHDTLLNNGTFTHTDQIDSRATLDALAIKFGTSGGGSVIRLNTKGLPLTSFQAAREGQDRKMVLNFESKSLFLTKDTTTIDGAAIPSGNYSTITGTDYQVYLNIAVSATVNLNFGKGKLFGNAVVDRIVAANGDIIALDSTDGAAIVAQLGTIEIAGFVSNMRRNNENKRTQGLQVSSMSWTEVYPMPIMAPLSTPSPIGSNRAAANQKSLLLGARMRTSNNAVTQQLAYLDMLEIMVGNLRDGQPVPEIAGSGRWFTHPFFERLPLDMSEALNSIQTHQKAADVQATLINAIRDVAYRMLRDSNYQAALDAMTGTTGKKPRLVIGTDPVIQRHLLVSGDSRTLGIGMDSEVVVTNDRRIKGKIIMSFVRNDFDGADPLSFGTHAFMPELVSHIQINRSGATFEEAMVHPRILHVNNLPVAAVLEVDSDALSEALRARTVTPIDGNLVMSGPDGGPVEVDNIEEPNP